MKGFYWGVHLATIPVKEQGDLLRQREEENCYAVAKAFSANPGAVKRRWCPGEIQVMGRGPPGEQA